MYPMAKDFVLQKPKMKLILSIVILFVRLISLFLSRLLVELCDIITSNSNWAIKAGGWMILFHYDRCEVNGKCTFAKTFEYKPDINTYIIVIASFQINLNGGQRLKSVKLPCWNCRRQNAPIYQVWLLANWLHLNATVTQRTTH